MRGVFYLKSSLWGLIIFLPVSCKQSLPEPYRVELPDKIVINDPDKEKYGQTVSIGVKSFAVKGFRKESLTDDVDYMKLTISEKDTGEQIGFKLITHVIRMAIQANAKYFINY